MKYRLMCNAVNYINYRYKMILDRRIQICKWVKMQWHGCAPYFSQTISDNITAKGTDAQFSMSSTRGSQPTGEADGW